MSHLFRLDDYIILSNKFQYNIKHKLLKHFPYIAYLLKEKLHCCFYVINIWKCMYFIEDQLFIVNI